MTSVIRKTFPCQMCDRHYSSTSKLKAHIRHVHDNAPKQTFICEICDKVFVTNSNKKRHVNTYHRQIVRYTCDVCGKGYNNTWQVKQHKDMVHRPPSHTCAECGKTFSLKSNWKRHAAVCSTGTDTTERLTCDICNKSFKKVRYLHDHMKQLHDTDRPKEVCEVCGESFTKKHSLKRHIDRKHSTD